MLSHRGATERERTILHNKQPFCALILKYYKTRFGLFNNNILVVRLAVCEWPVGSGGRLWGGRMTE